MAINHRKLLQQQDHNQNATCSDCGPTCRYKCTYPEIYWPPQPPPPPQHTTTARASPYVIIIVTLLGSALLFFSYYLIMVRCSKRFRRAPTSPISNQEQDFPNEEDRGVEVDHPIWYINTIGLQPSVINSITVFKYKKHDNLIDGTNCSVCLCEFQDNETLRLLPKCNHAFHIPCIDTWLSSHVNCPLCRAGILSDTLGAVLSSGDRNDFATTGMENLENDGESGGDPVIEIENCDDIEDLKTEYECVTGARRSISMDSVATADIIVGELDGISGDSTVNIVMSHRAEI